MLRNLLAVSQKSGTPTPTESHDYFTMSRALETDGIALEEASSAELNVKNAENPPAEPPISDIAEDCSYSPHLPAAAVAAPSAEQVSEVGIRKRIPSQSQEEEHQESPLQANATDTAPKDDDGVEGVDALERVRQASDVEEEQQNINRAGLILVYVTVFLDFMGVTLTMPSIRFFVDPTSDEP